MKKRSSGDLAQVRNLVRSAGLRCTAARMAVIQHLQQAKSPQTHAEIAEVMMPLGFDKATVFRNLIDLTDAGLVSRTELGDHVWRFELRDQNDPDSGTHPHFVCTDCGSVTCMDDVEFNAASERRASLIGRVTEILLKGQCRKCSG